jgi:hypothetical protein
MAAPYRLGGLHSYRFLVGSSKTLVGNKLNMMWLTGQLSRS